MIKDLAWNTFKKTGNINSYLEFVETENMEKQMEQNLLITEEKKQICPFVFVVFSQILNRKPQMKFMKWRKSTWQSS